MALIPDPENPPGRTMKFTRIGGAGPIDVSMLDSEEKTKIANAINNDKNIEFFIVATENLKNLIVKGHPIASQIPACWAQVFLEGNGIRIEKSMVRFWIEGKLDARNTFVLNNCDIRVEQNMKKIATSQTNKFMGKE